MLSVKIRVYAKFSELYITSVHSYNRGRYFPNLLGKTRMKLFIYSKIISTLSLEDKLAISKHKWQRRMTKSQINIHQGEKHHKKYYFCLIMIKEHCQINSEHKELTTARESMCKPQRFCLLNNPIIIVQMIVINCLWDFLACSTVAFLFSTICMLVNMIFLL